jgi:hypothetical protein
MEWSLSSESDMECSSVLGIVNPLTAEHLSDPLFQTLLSSKCHQECHALRVDGLLGIVDQDIVKE